MARRRAGGLVDPMKRPTVKQVVSWGGTALAIVTMAYLAYQLYTLSTNAEIDFASFASAGVILGLVFVTLFEGLGILLAGFNFRALVKNVSGILVKKPLALVVYTISNLYKYIPGGAMYVVGRNLLAVETEDLRHPEVALSTVIEGALVALAAIVIIVVTAFDHARDHLRGINPPTIVVLIIIVVLVLAASAAFIFRHKIMDGLRKLFKQVQMLRPLMLIKRFAFALLLMTLWGGTFLATLVVLGQEMSPGMAPSVIGMFLLAWLAGFLTPGAPSGAGVREITMYVFLGGMVNEGILLSAMVIHRVVAAAGDVAAYGVAVAYARIAKMRETRL